MTMNDHARFFDVLPDALCVVDAAGGIVASNPAFDRLVGADGADFGTRSWGQLFDCAQVADLAKASGAERLQTGTQAAVEWSVLDTDADGRRFVKINRSNAAVPQPAHPKAGGLTQARFLANISHEIRTPMNGIVGVSQLLLDIAQDDEIRRLAKIIEESGDALVSVVNDILDFSKIESEGLSIENIPFNIRELSRRLGALHELVARDKGLGFEMHVAPDMPQTWNGDPNRIAQICHNLIGNALKFTSVGKVVVRFSQGPSGAVEIAVQDTGIGMSPEAQSRIFEAFAQADVSTTRHFGGTGLGLSIARGLAELMGGRLDLVSAQDQGTTVTAILPLKENPEGMAHRDGYRHAVALPRGLRILAADDSETNLKVLSANLEKFGATVAMARNGQQAITLIGEQPFDLLLLDIAMPDLDGVETLARIRTKETSLGLAPVPALAVTAHSLPHQVAGFLMDGFASHVAKPVKRHELYTALAEVMAQASFNRSAAE